jgi:hypothetical protein
MLLLQNEQEHKNFVNENDKTIVLHTADWCKFCVPLKNFLDGLSGASDGVSNGIPGELNPKIPTIKFAIVDHTDDLSPGALPIVKTYYKGKELTHKTIRRGGATGVEKLKHLVAELSN